MMRFHNFLFYAFIFACFQYSPTSQANSDTAKLTIPKEFNLLALNGIDYSSNYAKTLQIVPLKRGQNRLALKYDVVWKDRQNSAYTIKSKVLIVTFFLANKDDFRLTYLKPATLSTSTRFAKAPSFKFVNRNNYSLNLKIALSPSQTIKYLKEQTKGKSILKKYQAPIIIRSSKK